MTSDTAPRGPAARLPRLALLFVSLLLLMVCYPLFGTSHAAVVALDLVFSATLVTSAYAVSDNRKVLLAASVLALPTLATWWGLRFVESSLLGVIGLSLSAVFFAFIVAVMTRNVIAREEVTMDAIFGAMSVYLLIGFTWALLYALVEVSTPGAFDFGPLSPPPGEFAQHGRLHLFSYYSLVTLSTLGYGDITPLTPMARALSSLEAVVGQLYIAVTIARLVGLHIAQRQPR